MRVVHLSSYARGGAAVAALRLHHALVASGCDSVFLTGEPAPKVRALARMPLRRWWKRPMEKVETLRHFSANLEPTRIHEQVRNYRPDIVHLHWVGDGFLPIGSLSKLGTPIVWTNHDLWSATGGCHYSGTCRRFEDRCGQCPALVDTRRAENDLSRRVWMEKASEWQGCNPALVTPSAWLAAEIRRSALFRDRPVRVIPYGLDLQAFRPMSRSAAREILRLPPDRFLIVFGAVAPTTDPRKGFAELRSALAALPERVASHATAVVFGADSAPDLAIPAEALGHLNDEVSLALAYAAADVVVVPSLEDNLPNIVLEAMACGRVVVAFDCGGIPEAVDSGRTGLTVRVGDAAALAMAIARVHNDKDVRGALETSARSAAESMFSSARQATDYLEIYSQFV